MLALLWPPCCHTAEDFAFYVVSVQGCISLSTLFKS